MSAATISVPQTHNKIKPTPARADQFWSKVNKDGPTMPHMESPCWVWTACQHKDGYGSVSLGGRMLLAHRVAWTFVNGAIPHNGSAHGICVLHRCDNRACVNPEHLFLGTQNDNIRDMEVKGRKITAHGDRNGARTMPERLARGAAVGNAKLTDAKVIDIRALWAVGGITKSEIGARFGVDRTAIRKIVTRKTWKHVP